MTIITMTTTMTTLTLTLIVMTMRVVVVVVVVVVVADCKFYRNIVSPKRWLPNHPPSPEVLLCGYPPFFGDTDSEVLAKARSQHKLQMI